MDMVLETRAQIKRRILRELQQELGGRIIGMRLMPLGDHLNGLVSDPSVMCYIGGDWFVVSTEPKQQNLARQSIADAGIAVYLPIIRRHEGIGMGAKRVMDRPMFGPYLFAKCRPCAEDWHKVVAARGVQRLLDGTDPTGSRRPFSLPEGAIEVIRLLEAETNMPTPKTDFIWHFTIGDKVRIKTGPFAQFYAQIDSAVDEHGRIRALVDLFGRKTLATFDADQLETG